MQEKQWVAYVDHTSESVVFDYATLKNMTNEGFLANEVRGPVYRRWLLLCQQYPDYQKQDFTEIPF